MVSDIPARDGNIGKPFLQCIYTFNPLLFSLANILYVLKVDGNEKRGGQEGDSNSASVWHCVDRGFELVVSI